MSLTNQLSLFIDVVQQGSFAKAAALHDMDNSSLSKQIKKLEASLGVQLLNRSTRSFSLTPAGEEILAQAQNMVETLKQIKNIADSYQSEPTGVLRITSPIYFGQQYLQPVITRFMKQYPKVQITLSLDDKRADIIGEHFDVAFRIGKLTESNLIAKKIANTNFAIVASECFIKEHGKPQTLEELLALPAVIYSNGSLNLDTIHISETPSSDKLVNIKMHGNYRVSDVRTMMDAVKGGLGYSRVDLFHLDSPINELKLIPLLTDYTLSNMNTGIYAVYPHRKHTPLVSEFIKAVQSYIGTPPFWEQHIPNYDQCYKGIQSPC
ncbi:LysR family transcriptional regulator [Photobacterium jeanii]|uniref:LysR family transcriptional regulator n=1 Tax=Photobacterium jeanii TaxID=858640 RepID=A0A178K2D4_9GAMM|nr:LysR family transcriptional regulator [Photobacterium jeanii]OAN11470.1 LysR family transcriptional regulator [Photobacterium jeanii]PST90990.1 LysR family transcriptional regulator [Photobacterium jeanii]